MENYLEHKIKVKFYDNVLSQNRDWQWFIDKIEKRFEGYSACINSSEEFMINANKMLDLYSYLIKINSIDGVMLKFSKPWLSHINLSAELFCGKKTLLDIWDKLADDFSKLFAIIVYVTKMINFTNSSDYIFNSLIFYQDNVYKIINLEKVSDKFTEIEHYIKQIKINDIDRIKGCFIRNINGIELKPNKELIEEYNQVLVSANAFNFQRINLPNNISWEVQYLFDMVNTNILNFELTPSLEYNGISFPNFSKWTEETLDEMIQYFNDKSASFIIETVRFFLYGVVPSDTTVSLHFQLLIKDLGQFCANDEFYKIKNSSLYTVNSLLNKKAVNRKIKNEYMPEYLKAIERFINPLTIMELKKCKSPISQKQRELLEDNTKKMVYKIETISAPWEFLDYCKNEYIYPEVTNDILQKAVNVFFNLISEEEDGVVLSDIFYEFMIFLLKVQKNISIDKANLKNVIIRIKNLWQNQYYKKCYKSLHTVSHKIEVNDKEIEKFNETVMANPMALVLHSMPMTDKSLVEIMSDISEHAFMVLVGNICIDEHFPMRKYDNVQFHEADRLFLDKITSLQKEYGYKMLNYIEPDKLLLHLYERFSDNIWIYFSFFNEEKILYERIKNRLKEDNLIEYDGNNLYSAHLLQLFPILENKIRDFGQCVNIVPFKEKIGEFMHMKDASNVLQQILIEVYNETKSFRGIEDLFFIFICMYNDNHLNIRNESCHGRDYLKNGKLKFAFKVSLLCLELILERLDRLKNQFND